MYTAATCPGIPRGNTPDTTWWSEFGSEAETFLYMAENGLKMSDETKQNLIKEVAELNKSDITDDDADIIEDLEKYVIPILGSDDKETVLSKIDYNTVLTANMELQLSHRKKLF